MPMQVLGDFERDGHIFPGLNQECRFVEFWQILTVIGLKYRAQGRQGMIDVLALDRFGEVAGQFRLLRIAHGQGCEAVCPAG